MTEFTQLVALAAQRGASDLHLVCGLPPQCRVHGQLLPLEAPPLTHDDCENLAHQIAGEAYGSIAQMGEVDLAITLAGRRLRINLFRQQGHVSGAVRLLAQTIPQLETLGLPPAVVELSQFPSGLVLVTGETGSGKSTTLAALLDHINHTRRCHIVTLEDPIEYCYTPDQALINQRELGRDTANYAAALRAVLREDPDVILIGEMRDAETIEAALTAAETGHLVFATLHTNSAAGAIDRVAGAFPGARQGQLRMQLSTTLRAVISQRLLPRQDGAGRVLVSEVMMVTNAVANLIREGKTPQLQSALATSAAAGSVTLDSTLIRLGRQRLISAEDALRCAQDPEFVRRSLPR